MTTTFTEHFRFAIPDFLTEPWHATWEETVHHIDRVLYGLYVDGGFEFWENDEDYEVGDRTIDPADGSRWIAIVEHTSPSPPTTFAQDRVNNPNRWVSASTGFVNAFNMEVVIDGIGAVITPGVKGNYKFDFPFVIQSLTMLSDQAGSIVVDVWKDTYGNYPPSNADSITGAAPPTISGDDQSVDNTLVGWNTVVNAGDIFRFNVDSCSGIRQVTLVFKCVRT